MDFLQDITITDLVVIVTLAGGVLVGFQQGMLRYILNAIVVVAAFILASVLKGPIADAVGEFWDYATPEQQELWFYLLLLIIGIVGGWFLVRTFYRQTRLPIIRQLDEIGGAVLGVVWVALMYTVTLLVLDSFFLTADEQVAARATILGPLYDFLNNSLILDLFRQWLVPVIGFIARPFVPSDIDQILSP